MNTIYYVEINISCIIILSLFARQVYNRFIKMSDIETNLNHLIWATMVLCATDMVAGIWRGQIIEGARTVIELSNLLYFEMMVIISYLWFRHVILELNENLYYSKKAKFFTWLPLAIFTMIAVTNPFTHFLFLIDENNLYVRNDGIIVHWAIAYGYLIVATILVIVKIVREKNKLRRRAIIPLMYFFIAPFIAAMIQMLFYGITSTQVGITISLVMICLSYQKGQIVTDLLTSLNNRNGLYKFLNDYVGKHSEIALTLIMIDVNNFKHVNDRFGHGEGDNALKNTAVALKEACKEISGRPFLCRYGGDEFVVALIGMDKEGIKNLEQSIKQKTLEQSMHNEVGYKLFVSLGSATGVCATLDEAEQLLATADEAMYKAKVLIRGSDNHFTEKD